MAEEKEFQEFPKMKYRGTESKIVKDRDEEEELGAGWGDTPGFEATPAPQPAVDPGQSNPGQGSDPQT